MEPIILDENVSSGKIHWSQSKDFILFLLKEKQRVGFHFIRHLCQSWYKQQVTSLIQ